MLRLTDKCRKRWELLDHVGSMIPEALVREKRKPASSGEHGDKRGMRSLHGGNGLTAGLLPLNRNNRNCVLFYFSCLAILNIESISY